MKWFAFVSVLFAIAGPACACECIQQPWSRVLASATRVYVGDIISSKQQPIGPRSDFYFHQIVEFRVTTALKGVKLGEIIVSDTRVGPGGCTLSTAAPTGRDPDFAFKSPPPPPGQHQHQGRLDYSRWLIVDEPDGCTGSHPLPVSEPKADLEVRKVRRLLRATRWRR